MDISAKSLNKRSGMSSTNDVVEEIYKSIRVRIHESNKMGMSSITYDLPNTYTIGNLEPMDAQLLVYSKIIEKIEAIGLKVSISINPATDISTLEISWPSQLDSAEKTRMRNIILSHLKK